MDELLLKMIVSVIITFFLFQWKIKSNSFAVRQLHMEFLRAGSDVMQTFTFSASEDNMESQVAYNVAAGGGAGWEEGSH